MEMLQIVDPAVDHDYLDTLRHGKDLVHLNDILCFRGDLLRDLHLRTDLWTTPGSMFDLQSMLRSAFMEYWTQSDSVPSSSSDAWHFCPTCYTAYQIKVETSSSGLEEQYNRSARRERTPFAIRVTRLSDLGEGKTRNSLQWRTTVDWSYRIDRRFLPAFDPWPEHCETEGEVLNAFAERERRESAHYAPFALPNAAVICRD